jgi:hypothetical protein
MRERFGASLDEADRTEGRECELDEHARLMPPVGVAISREDALEVTPVA